MPKLKFMVACEKVIFDQDGPVSLISIFQRMMIQLTGTPLPDKAISPTLWNTFVLWESTPDELGQEFTQILKVIAPDGAVFIEQEVVFKNNSADEPQVRIKSIMPGLPIWQEGWVTLSACLKDDEAAAEEFKFEIKYVHPPNALADQA